MVSGIQRRVHTSVPRRRGVRPRASVVLPRLLAVILAALIALPIAEGAPPVAAGKNKKTKTISRTVSATGQVDIPAAGTAGPANPYPVTIDADVFEQYDQARITDVNLILNAFEHDQATNVDVMLVHAGRSALVMADAGNSTDVSGLTIVLDDEAVADLPDGVALTSGTFRPGNQSGADDFAAPAPAPNGNVALSTFDGANADGQWQLFVHDDNPNFTGRLSGGWALEITAKVTTGKGKDNDKGNDKGKDKKRGKKNKK
jgi:hypothetical protein